MPSYPSCHSLTAFFTRSALLLPAIIFAGAALCVSPSSLHAKELGVRKLTKQQRNLPKLYQLSLGKPWAESTAFFPSTIELAAKSRRPNQCGTDTFFTIQSDFLNDMPRGTLADFFTRIPQSDVTSLVRRLYYPKGEVFEKTAPMRVKFANTEAYKGQYNIHFSNGKKYALRYYMTYQSGYMVHIAAYSLLQDRDRAGDCFDELFESLTFLEVPI